MINLLPPAEKEAIRFGRHNTHTFHYLLLVLATGIGLITILIFGLILVSREERLLKNLAGDKQAALSGYSQELGQAKVLAQRIDTIAALLDRETAFSKLLPSIGAVVPAGTTINGLELDTTDANTLSINGESTTQNGPSVFRENLAKTDKLFSRADIVSITLVEKENAPDVYAFQVDVQFATGAKQELGP